METEKANLDRYVHQLANGRWIVAVWDGQANQWLAPMTELECQVTGCHTYFARTIENLGATSYAQRSSAVRRARQIYT